MDGNGRKFKWKMDEKHGWKLDWVNSSGMFWNSNLLFVANSNFSLT